MKVIAYYLPQYHETEENNKWWGEGFTEWTSLKKSKALFEGHYQPRIPLNNNYYNLEDDNVKKWQIELAKKYGIYGFCVYHYWSEQGMLLNKPMEQYLENKELDLPFCFCWANETWSNSWATDSRKPQVLWRQTYGGKDEWKRHFDYLLPFFKDKRYIKENNNPILVIYKPDLIPNLNEMLDYLNDLAVQNGFAGIYFASQQKEFHINKCDDSRMKYKIEYSPSFAPYDMASKRQHIAEKIRRKIINFVEEKTKFSIPKTQKLSRVSYDDIWNAILKRQPDDDKMIPGALTDWDNTPRYGMRGSLYDGATPEKFYKYFKKQIVHARDDYKKDKIFIFAWNEWTEGGYLEPDEKWEYGYLEAVYKALKETDELEDMNSGGKESDNQTIDC